MFCCCFPFFRMLTLFYPHIALIVSFYHLIQYRRKTSFFFPRYKKKSVGSAAVIEYHIEIPPKLLLLILISLIHCSLIFNLMDDILRRVEGFSFILILYVRRFLFSVLTFVKKCCLLSK